MEELNELLKEWDDPYGTRDVSLAEFLIFLFTIISADILIPMDKSRLTILGIFSLLIKSFLKVFDKLYRIHTLSK